jgi:cysteine-rich repeat protein
MRPISSFLLLVVGACSLRIPSKPNCGDGEVQLTEECDDKNLNSGDGCSSICLLEVNAPVCGNSVLEGDELCDDGNILDGDGCSSFCRIELVSCGDGILNLGEQCDDGVANSNTLPDACRLDCFFPTCGDNVTDTGEGCDDGNFADADGCEADCSLPGCSNGIVDPGEVCFDAAPLTLVETNHPRGIDIADLNQDGKLDLVVSEQGQSGVNGAFGDGLNDEVVVFIQNNNGGFFAPSGIIVGDASRFVRAKDVSGDGNPEIFVTHQFSDTLSILDNQNGALIFTSSFGVPGPAELALGDIDNDQIIDVAVAASGSIEVFLASQAIQLSVNTGCSTEGVDLGDVDNDGILDVLAVCGEGVAANQIKLFSGADILFQGNGIAPLATFSLGTTRVGRFGDFDSDGLLDFAIAERSIDSVVFFFQQANGTFTQTAEAVGNGVISLAVSDMNRDGIVDVLSVEQNSGLATILISNGDQSFTKKVFATDGNSRVGAVGDLNQDTLPDFAITNLESDSITVYLSTP